MHRAFLGLGSNLGDRAANLRIALDLFGEQVAAVSPVYETEPFGLIDQPDFYNAVIELQTDSTPEELLDQAVRAETIAQRERSVPNGPRTLDVDIIWFEGERRSTPELTIPHPGMWERRTVLVPLRDIAPDLVPDSALDGLAGRCDRTEVRLR